MGRDRSPFKTRLYIATSQSGIQDKLVGTKGVTTFGSENQ